MYNVMNCYKNKINESTNMENLADISLSQVPPQEQKY